MVVDSPEGRIGARRKEILARFERCGRCEAQRDAPGPDWGGLGEVAAGATLSRMLHEGRDLLSAGLFCFRRSIFKRADGR